MLRLLHLRQNSKAFDGQRVFTRCWRLILLLGRLICFCAPSTLRTFLLGGRKLGRLWLCFVNSTHRPRQSPGFIFTRRLKWHHKLVSFFLIGRRGSLTLLLPRLLSPPSIQTRNSALSGLSSTIGLALDDSSSLLWLEQNEAFGQMEVDQLGLVVCQSSLERRPGRRLRFFWAENAIALWTSSLHYQM